MSEQDTSGQTTETSADNLIPPGAVGHEPPSYDAWVQTATLAHFLEENFPEEIIRTNLQQPETPVDTAMRLLLALSSQTPPSQVQRCTEPYCNRNAGHHGDHGWVHAG